MKLHPQSTAAGGNFASRLNRASSLKDGPGDGCFSTATWGKGKNYSSRIRLLQWRAEPSRWHSRQTYWNGGGGFLTLEGFCTPSPGFLQLVSLLSQWWACKPLVEWKTVINRCSCSVPTPPAIITTWGTAAMLEHASLEIMIEHWAMWMEFLERERSNGFEFRKQSIWKWLRVDREVDHWFSLSVPLVT